MSKAHHTYYAVITGDLYGHGPGYSGIVCGEGQPSEMLEQLWTRACDGNFPAAQVDGWHEYPSQRALLDNAWRHRQV